MQWLNENRVSDMSFARAIHASPMTVKNWKWGKNIPTLLYAVKIERATGGVVPVYYWASTPLAKKIQAEMADGYKNFVEGQKERRIKYNREATNAAFKLQLEREAAEKAAK